MKRIPVGIPALAFACSLGLATAALAMTKDEYRAGKDRIAADYKSEKERCASLAHNARDICVAEARGNEKVAKAELEANYKPTQKNRYDDQASLRGRRFVAAQY